MKSIETLALEYADKFGDNFPFFGYDGEEPVEIAIQKCLESGKPYEADYSEDAEY